MVRGRLMKLILELVRDVNHYFKSSGLSNICLPVISVSMLNSSLILSPKQLSDPLRFFFSIVENINVGIIHNSVLLCYIRIKLRLENWCVFFNI